MDIAIIGAGYVGLVTGGGLAKLGHRVRLGEADKGRVEFLKGGGVPIFEVGLPELLSDAVAGELMTFHTSNVEAVDGARFVFLCLPTPEGEDGRANLKYINSVIEELANVVSTDTTFVVKSTVPPGTVTSIRKKLADLGSPAHVVSHPEFLREGRAVQDFLEPDRIVVGAWDDAEASAVADLYKSLGPEVVKTDPTSAEMIKYASNAYLATRLTFVNTLANVAEAVGADILDVVEGLGLDHRIGRHFLQPGPGYGGSCFPKDTMALIAVAADAGYEFDLLQAVIEADEKQRRRVVDKVRNAAGGNLEGRKVGMWGVAFKAGTDDVRESPAVRIASLIIEEGADVVAYDPEASSDLVTMAASPVEAVRGADVLLVATEWDEFKTVDMGAVAEVMTGVHVIDARNLLDPKSVRAVGLDYWGFGRPGA